MIRIKNQVEINDDACGTCSTNSQIEFRTSMLKSSLCDYSDAYILVSGTITFSKYKNYSIASCRVLATGGDNNREKVKLCSIQ